MELLAVSLDGGLLLYSKSWGGGCGLVHGENAAYQSAATLFALYLTAKQSEGEVEEEKGEEKGGNILRVERGNAVLHFHETTTTSFLTVSCMKAGISHSLAQEVTVKTASIIESHGLSATNSPRQSTLKAIQMELETMLLDVLCQQAAALFHRTLLPFTQSTCIGIVVVPSAETTIGLEAVGCPRLHFRRALSSSAKESETLLAAPTEAVPLADNKLRDDNEKSLRNGKPSSLLCNWMVCFSKSRHRVTHHSEPSSTSPPPPPPPATQSMLHDEREKKCPGRMWRRQGTEAGDDERSESFTAMARRCALENYTDLADNRSVMVLRTRADEKREDDAVVVHDLENEAADPDSHPETRPQTNSLQISCDYGVFVFYDTISRAAGSSWQEVKPGISVPKRNYEQETELRDFCLFARFCLVHLSNSCS